jgi:hypothetical protein
MSKCATLLNVGGAGLPYFACVVVLLLSGSAAAGLLPIKFRLSSCTRKLLHNCLKQNKLLRSTSWFIECSEQPTGLYCMTHMSDTPGHKVWHQLITACRICGNKEFSYT